MKQRHLLLWLMLIICSLGASGEDAPGNSNNYTILLEGLNQVKIKVPVYDQNGSDSWVYDGNVYYQAEGSSNKVLLYNWWVKNWDIDGDANAIETYMRSQAAGSVQLIRTLPNYCSPIITSDIKCWWLERVAGEYMMWATIVWTVPHELRGKNITFSWKVGKTGNKKVRNEYVRIPDSTIGIPDAPSEFDPVVMTPVLSYETSHAGEIMIPWIISANTVTKATVTYHDKTLDETITSELEASPTGNIYVPANHFIDNLYVTVDYLDSEKHQVKGRKSSPAISVPTLHNPKLMEVQYQNDGTAKLTWHTSDSNWDDILDGDYWEIERNLTGSTNPNDTNWEGIGMEMYDQNQLDYEFTDESLPKHYESKPVAYRVRRVSTANWGWSHTSIGSTQTKSECIMALPSIENAQVTKAADWGQNFSHKVQLSWNLSKSEISQKGESNTQYIYTENDWETFAQTVNTGQVNRNAKLMVDLTLGAEASMIGNSENPYSGHFDGNGCTLTVNLTAQGPGVGVFRNVEGAVISDLHVAGTITTGFKFASGIVAYLGSAHKTTLERCRSSVTINSTVDGDGSHGGLIGQIYGSATAIITDCLFDGKLLGSKTTNCGGFIGWFGPSAKVILTNCLFDPAELKINETDDSRTFARTYSYHEDGKTYKNCYYIRLLGKAEGAFLTYNTDLQGSNWHVVNNKLQPVFKHETVVSDGLCHIYSVSDWEYFAQQVSSGKTDLSAILHTDIDLSGSSAPSVGTSDHPYSGSFNGNGYTVTVNITSRDEFAGLFRYVQNASISNLNVAGTLNTSSKFAGTIVAYVMQDASLSLSRCCSSVTINSTTNGDGSHGGLLGLIHGSSTVNISDCRFDGRFNLNNKTTNCGGLVGYRGSNTRLHLNQCLFAPEEAGQISGCAALVRNTATRGVGSLTINKCFYTKAFNEAQGVRIGLSAQVQVDSLGINWTISDNNLAIPKPMYVPNIYIWDKEAKLVLYLDKYVDGKLRYTERRDITEEERTAGKAVVALNTSCVDYEFRLGVERNDSPFRIDGNADDVQEAFYAVPTGMTEEEQQQQHNQFYFDNNVQITSLNFEPLQTSVLLKWETSGGDADYYRILRRDREKKDTLVLEAEYNQTTYVDKTIQPQHEYDYIVEGITVCEGKHTSTKTVVGYCIKTGMVRGYVRLADGTALANRTVTATPVKGSGTDKGKVVTTTTDENGFYEISGLIYNKEGSYEITVATTGEEDPYQPLYAAFNDKTNMVVNLIFAQNNYFRLTGSVLYEGSSIPVVGAQFKRDGQLVKNASGEPVTTNSKGQFSVSIPKGTHQIQVVKEGHVFMNEGYYLDEDGSRDINWQDNKYEAFLWDQTKVRLRGRVVGGHIQGDLPLGQSLSKNNLGDGITMVFQLEGDNSSYIVRDQLNDNVKERHETFRHGATDPKTGKGKDLTRMDSYRQRIVVYPDSLTGEYEVLFYPVKFKVTEIYASGYSTLFQAGTVAETLDLTDESNGAIAEYNRIYHAAPELHYHQLNMLDEDYLGLKQYVAMDITGQRETITLWDKDHGYTMGYPVFMAKSAVTMNFTANEEYYYNNNTDSQPDVVPLGNSQVFIQNGLISTEESVTLELDSLGQGSYTFTPDNTTFIEHGENALQRMSMTMLNDSTYYNHEPLRAFVMAAVPKNQGRRVVAKGGTYLLDILRDPPGSTSSAYIESGTKLSYSFKCDWSASGGIKLALNKGTGANYYMGIWGGAGGGITSGNTFSTSSSQITGLTVTVNYNNTWNYSYELATTERIQTSANAKNIGAAADLYIGLTKNAIVEDAIAVRTVNSQMYKYLSPREGGKVTVGGHEYNVKKGAVEILARGWDAQKQDSVYLIRDEVLSMSTELNSSFVHSQDYILKELIPDLLRQRAAKMLPMGTSESEAQMIANTSKSTVYISKVAEDHPYYGMTDDKGNPTYTPVYAVVDGNVVTTTDEIAAFNQEVVTWAGFIEKNEKEKLEASELVKSYDFDGRAGVQYSESFSMSTAETRYMKLPFVDGLEGVFPSFGAFSNLLSKANKSTTSGSGAMDDEGNTIDIEIEAFSVKLDMKITPVLSALYNYAYGKTTSYSKKTGFTLGTSNKSSLLVDVYRTKSDLERLRDLSEGELKNMVKNGSLVLFPVLEEEMRKSVKKGHWNKANALTSWLSYYKSSTPVYTNFVYRTRAGVTCQPYEDQRVTQFYQPGTVLDVKTEAIDNLHIWTDNANVSNVPYGEPARYTLHISNETMFPDRASLFFNYSLDNTTNTKGAKVYVDGSPLNGTGYTLYLIPGQVITKQVEVYAGADFDYENIGICINDPNDVLRVFTQRLSAHFVPTAGKVNISMPGDKWVVNTESEYDKKRQDYFLPVQIDGFDVNFRNFDHIELQYKLDTQGDKDWVNVCSYYSDKKLMALASGVRDTIANDGIIKASFYGEGSPIEQTYDLRAVVYCRYGNGYLTSSSNILKGIKDTRCPQLFTSPMPSDGIMDIGDDILLRFSEPIAGNYLRKENNFQVLGQTNSSNIVLSTALRFNSGEPAVTAGVRNLGAKSFTVDMMLNPDANGKNMTVFSHGSGQNKLELGITSDRHLTAAVNDKVFTSASAINFNKALHQVQYVFEVNDDNTTNVSFYDGSLNIGTFKYDHLYNGDSKVYLGANRQNALPGSGNYEGEMLEYRLWNRALTTGEMSSYSQKVLTGYELGLLDNYAMNEGRGLYSYNRVTSGSDLQINGQTWKVPGGIGMKLDGAEGFEMKADKFIRTANQDYTMMFWFRTTDADGTLLSNGAAEQEADYANHFNFGVSNGLMNLHLGGKEITTNATVNDGGWHHAALTVSRSRNVGNLYVDDNLKNTFSVDTIGGIMGSSIYAGVTYVNAKTKTRPITGHIDEIAMYESVLPEHMIKNYTNVMPSGEELSMMAYLSFSTRQLQMENEQLLVPSGVSLKRYKDNNTGQFTAQRDTIISQDVIDRLADKVDYAPMRDATNLINIPFSFVADGKDLLVSLDLPDNQLEKTNVVATVKEVPDLNGNLMASPVTMNFYIYRNPLRWDKKRLTVSTKYGFEGTFEATIKNLSGLSKNYSLEGHPLWITPSKSSGVIGALDEETITFTVSPYINIGDYDEIIYLQGEDGMTEQLPLEIKVRGVSPNFAVPDTIQKKNITMHVIARVEIDGNVAHEATDILTAFSPQHQVLGTTLMDVDEADNANDGLAYLTVYNNSNDATPITFEYYDASTGRLYVLSSENGTFNFSAGSVVGTTTAPLILKNTDEEVHIIGVEPGWNWLSTYVQPKPGTLNDQLLNCNTWNPGDAFELIDDNGKPELFTCVWNNGKYVWDTQNITHNLDIRYMYRFYSDTYNKIFLTGVPTNTSVTVKKGWNRIAYSTAINLPIGTALADYTDQATPGDIIKSQDMFAVLTTDASGVPTWKGTLKFMQAGTGYMLQRTGEGTVQFSYPTYQGNTRYSSRSAAATTYTTRAAALHTNRTMSSMNVVATVDGVQLQEGDRLLAIVGADTRGVATAEEDGLFYLSIDHGDAHHIGFVIEREGEIIAMTNTTMAYAENRLIGTPDNPTTINFVTADKFQGEGWYDLQGRKLDTKPVKRGVYIHDGQKVIINSTKQ